MKDVTTRSTNRITLLPLVGPKFQILPEVFLSTEIKMIAYEDFYKFRRDTYYKRLDDDFFSIPFFFKS
jgi:hypothetical protein